MLSSLHVNLLKKNNSTLSPTERAFNASTPHLLSIEHEKDSIKCTHTTHLLHSTTFPKGGQRWIVITTSSKKWKCQLCHKTQCFVAFVALFQLSLGALKSGISTIDFSKACLCLKWHVKVKKPQKFFPFPWKLGPPVNTCARFFFQGDIFFYNLGGVSARVLDGVFLKIKVMPEILRKIIKLRKILRFF